mmetsp:Transcript_4145/g.9636  ORF Transcript_4145/g.9636 Transcript_4145/m.9636 type:complete len:80 (+) Transcript_4145:53-292(+)
MNQLGNILLYNVQKKMCIKQLEEFKFPSEAAAAKVQSAKAAVETSCSAGSGRKKQKNNDQGIKGSATKLAGRHAARSFA